MRTLRIRPRRSRAAVRCSGEAYVLDDEPQVGALVCKVLEGCGIVARQFTLPAPFLEALETSPPGLIVLDLSLGQSDAVEIIRHLEARKFAGQVLLISGRDHGALDEIAQIGTRHGLTMLPPLRKPFRPRDLKLRLAEGDVQPYRKQDLAKAVEGTLAARG